MIKQINKFLVLIYMRNKRRSHNWYLESRKKSKREKCLFYSLVFIAFIMFLFSIYISRGN